MKKKYIGKIILIGDDGKEEIVWKKEFFTLFFAETITKVKYAFRSTFDFDFCKGIVARIEKIGE